MSERDELAGIVRLEHFDGTAEQVAEAILAAGYRKLRTVTTAEELDALPVGSVVLDKYDGAWTKASNGSATWWFTGDGLDFESKSSLGVASLFGPATVLHEPEQAVSEP